MNFSGIIYEITQFLFCSSKKTLIVRGESKAEVESY